MTKLYRIVSTFICQIVFSRRCLDCSKFEFSKTYFQKERGDCCQITTQINGYNYQYIEYIDDDAINHSYSVEIIIFNSCHVLFVLKIMLITKPIVSTNRGILILANEEIIHRALMDADISFFLCYMSHKAFWIDIIGKLCLPLELEKVFLIRNLS